MRQVEQCDVSIPSECARASGCRSAGLNGQSCGAIPATPGEPAPDRGRHRSRSQCSPAPFPAWHARITPPPAGGDPARVCGCGQTAVAGWPGTGTTERDAGDRLRRRAGDITRAEREEHELVVLRGDTVGAGPGSSRPSGGPRWGVGRLPSAIHDVEEQPSKRSNLSSRSLRAHRIELSQRLLRHAERRPAQIFARTDRMNAQFPGQGDDLYTFP